MKKLWILSVIVISAFAHGKELNTFSEISKTLIQGNSIRLVVQPENSDPNKSTFSFFTEASAVMIRPTYLQFANTHLTTNHPGFEKKPLLENVTYRIIDNGDICITTRVITLPDYQIKSEHSMTCLLGLTAKVYAND